MKIAIGSDHAGFELKQHVITYLKSKGYDVEDVGTYNDQPSDYPDFADLVCERIIEKEANIGVLICGTGIGMSICANRNVGIKAALCTNILMAQKARNHNDANILVLGSKILSVEEAINITEVFLSSSFEGGRHIARLEKFN